MNGNPLLHLLLLAVPAAAALFWWDGARARERAIEYARRACRQRELQLLDQTVALGHWRAARAPGGALRIRRRFDFEFTQQGEHRDRASVTLLGATLESVHFPYTRDEEGRRVFLH